MPQRALITALGLALLLLADGLAVAPGHAVVAKEAGDGEGGGATDVVDCASGFSDVDSKVDMSLYGVALTGRGAIAVGYTRRRDPGDNGTRAPASIVNQGGEWSRVPTVSPGDEDGLMAVAWRDDTETWAAGFTTSGGQLMPLAMRWNGSEWKTDKPRLDTTLPALFTDITIVSDGRPMAVGYRMSASGRRKPLVIRKDGSRWRGIPFKTTAKESVSLTAVAPDRIGGVWVVGHGGPGAKVGPIIYRREGGKWTRFKMPRLKGEAALTDVVSVHGGQSWAVGYHRHDGRSDALVLRWDGKKWKRVKPPKWESIDVMLSAVAIDPDGGIWVVGAAWDDEIKSHEAVAAWWDGRAWNEVAGRAGGTELHDVIGSLDEDGWAVGRSQEAARATRVCTPPQSGVFGASEPLPSPGLTADGSTIGRVAVAVGTDAAAAARTATLVGTQTPAQAAEAGGAEEAAAGAKSTKAQQKAKARKKKAAKKKARQKARVVIVKTGTLPAATTDGSILVRDVAKEAGVFEDTATYDAVVDDFDGDGLDDLFVGRHGRKGRLLLNRGGFFVEHEALQMQTVDRHGCTSADIDGSGLPDLYCAVGGKRGSGLKSNELTLDPGGPAPVEVGAMRGLADPTGRGRASVFLEAAKQQDSKLVVTNSPTRVDGLPSLGRLYTTNGDGQFKAKGSPGFASRMGAQAVQSADYDGDGREDLLLVTGGQQSPEPSLTRLYRNTRKGLVDATKSMGIRSFGEVDAELVDVNRDGKLDLVQLSHDQLRVSVFKKGKFRKVYQRKLTNGRALATGDMNGDSKGDIYIVRGNGDRNYPDVMLVNRNGGAQWSSLILPQVSSGAGGDAYAIDHDGNGLDDFFVLNGHNERGPTQLIAFYRS